MRFLIARAINPHIDLLAGLRNWNQIASSLREPPRKRRGYQLDDLDQFLS